MMVVCWDLSFVLYQNANDYRTMPKYFEQNINKNKTNKSQLDSDERRYSHTTTITLSKQTRYIDDIIQYAYHFKKNQYFFFWKIVRK